MQQITFHNLSLLADPQRTAEIYANDLFDWCQCDGCRAARIARHSDLSQEVRKFIRALGADPDKPIFSSGHGPDKHKNHHAVFTLSFLVFGRPFGPDRPEIARIDDSTSIQIGSHPDDLEGWARDVEYYWNEGETLLVQVTLKLKYLLGEVCELRTLPERRCAYCGNHWLTCAFLKSRSLVPEWYGQPEFADRLKRKNHRVKATFCEGCGRCQLEFVPPKRPYFVPNRLQKKQRKYLDRLVRRQTGDPAHNSDGDLACILRGVHESGLWQGVAVDGQQIHFALGRRYHLYYMPIPPTQEIPEVKQDDAQ